MLLLTTAGLAVAEGTGSPAAPKAKRAEPHAPPARARAAMPPGPPALVSLIKQLHLPVASWVVRENEKPGTTSWHLTDPASGGQIEGYANRVSIDEGGSVTLYVSTTAPSYRVYAYRMGWYGGTGGRLVWASPALPGHVQPAPQFTPGINLVECDWTPSLVIRTTVPAWPQGDYLFKLVASTGYQSYVPLTIRDDASHAAFVINNDVTTWQAYNLWGGYDLYAGPTSGGGSALANRARVVSFDRPYKLGDGAGDFVGLELPMVELVESLGLDVTYQTDIDLAEHPGRLLDHRAFISLGHDEYYSLSMRNGLINARHHGVNLLFLGANAIYRHIRLASSPLGPDRLEIDYKDAKADPLYGKDNARVTPWAWQDPPNNAPPSQILGEEWQCNPVRAAMVVTDPSSWVYAGTGLTSGEQLPNVIGPEYDEYLPGQEGPADVQILAHSPLTCDGQPGYADMTYYTSTSGAGVIDTGTIDWVGFVSGACRTGCPNDPVVSALTRVTENILSAFGQGPAGRLHPSVPNAGTLAGS